jgi:hypothetical protein
MSPIDENKVKESNQKVVKKKKKKKKKKLTLIKILLGG